MKWTSGNTIGIAKTGCAECNGHGIKTHAGTVRPCGCALRAIFRICLARFKFHVSTMGNVGTVSLETCSKGRDSRRQYGRRSGDYVADFCIVSRKSLNPFEYKLFSAHFLLGADWKLVCRQMNMTRGNFFHAVYRIEEKLGRIFAELEPYVLYPLDEYFGNVLRDNTPVYDPPAEEKHVLRPPLAEPDLTKVA